MKDLDRLKKKKSLKDAAIKANLEKAEANSKRKFATSLKTKFKTTMVGSLVKIEEIFGDLWGHNKPYNELDEFEKEMRERWELVRTEILNKGNQQLRYALDELSRHRISYEGYKFDLPVKTVRRD